MSTTGVPTNFLTLPIGNGVCEDPALAAGGSAISRLYGQATVNAGVVLLYESTAPFNGNPPTTSDVGLAEFQSYTGSTYGTSNSGAVSIGGCMVQQNSGSNGVPGRAAGTITITGPSGSATLPEQALNGTPLVGYYFADLAAGFIPASGGTFQVTGSGGNNVGPFTTQVIYPNPVMTWTNQSAAATISRSTGMTVIWNGGDPGTFVMISGYSPGDNASGSFTCLAP